MAIVSRFEDLNIWGLARELENQIFNLTKKENFKKDFGLVTQINRATVSIMSNIAEGFGRGSNKEYLNFIIIAKGSINEVQSQLYNARDRGYIEKDDFEKVFELSQKTAGGITNFMKNLKTSLEKDFRKNET
jgi:four helix bundle protein